MSLNMTQEEKAVEIDLQPTCKKQRTGLNCRKGISSEIQVNQGDKNQVFADGLERSKLVVLGNCQE